MLNYQRVNHPSGTRASRRRGPVRSSSPSSCAPSKSSEAVHRTGAGVRRSASRDALRLAQSKTGGDGTYNILEPRKLGWVYIYIDYRWLLIIFYNGLEKMGNIVVSINWESPKWMFFFCLILLLMDDLGVQRNCWIRTDSEFSSLPWDS